MTAQDLLVGLQSRRPRLVLDVVSPILFRVSLVLDVGGARLGSSQTGRPSEVDSILQGIHIAALMLIAEEEGPQC